MGEGHNFHGGLSASLTLVINTSIMQCVAMETKGAWSLTKKKCWSMNTTQRHQSILIDASGMDVLASQARRDLALDLTMGNTRRP